WLSGAGRRLPRHTGLSASDAQARRLGRAAGWGGEGLAWTPAVLAARPLEGELRQRVGCRRPKPQALAHHDRLGTPARTSREPGALLHRTLTRARRSPPLICPPPSAGRFSTGCTGVRSSRDWASRQLHHTHLSAIVVASLAGSLSPIRLPRRRRPLALCGAGGGGGAGAWWAVSGRRSTPDGRLSRIRHSRSVCGGARPVGGTNP